jgi:hypothetical protein
MRKAIRRAIPGSLLATLIAVAPFTVNAQSDSLEQPTPMVVKLTQPISTKANQKGDKVTGQVVSPEIFKGDMVEGEIKEVRSGGLTKKTSILNFGFTKLHHRGQEMLIRSEITGFTNSNGKATVDEEGQVLEKSNQLGKMALITGAGAAIGAIAGGGKGAAIGAGAGAAASLLFVKFGSKAPNISFDAGSEFQLNVTRPR